MNPISPRACPRLTHWMTTSPTTSPVVFISAAGANTSPSSRSARKPIRFVALPIARVAADDSTVRSNDIGGAGMTDATADRAAWLGEMRQVDEGQESALGPTY